MEQRRAPFFIRRIRRSAGVQEQIDDAALFLRYGTREGVAVQIDPEHLDLLERRFLRFSGAQSGHPPEEEYRQTRDQASLQQADHAT
jgi:hypothetical protein